MANISRRLFLGFMGAGAMMLATRKVPAPALAPPFEPVSLPPPNVPAGFLACDGRMLSRAAYPELFAAVGTTYGGDEQNFRLPTFPAFDEVITKRYGGGAGMPSDARVACFVISARPEEMVSPLPPGLVVLFSGAVKQVEKARLL